MSDKRTKLLEWTILGALFGGLAAVVLRLDLAGQDWLIVALCVLGGAAVGLLVGSRGTRV